MILLGLIRPDSGVVAVVDEAVKSRRENNQRPLEKVTTVRQNCNGSVFFVVDVLLLLIIKVING